MTAVFELPQKSIDLYKIRYLNGSETIDDLWTRVAGGNNEYKELMEQGLFLPNSPALFNMGTGNGCTSSACFVFDVQDYMISHDGKVMEDSIVRTREKAIAVAKAGGGVGYYFGYLRAKGSPIKSVHRVACGPVTVMFDYHGIHKLVTQGGKRDMAQMGILPVTHPDVKEFIHCKDANPQALSSFNISVGWDQTSLDKTRDPQSQFHTIWNEQVTSAWGHGCPGMWFPDRVNVDNPNPHLGRMNAPNPCVVGDTLLLTENGYYRIKDVVGKAVRVWNGVTWSEVVPQVTGTDQPVVRVSLDDGHYLDCTPNHTFYLSEGQKVQAKDLKGGDRLEKYGMGTISGKGAKEWTGPDRMEEAWEAYLSGFYCGDGNALATSGQQFITFYGKEKIDIGLMLASRGLVILEGSGTRDGKRRATLTVNVPDKLEVPLNARLNYRLYWLAGILDSDGCVVYSDRTKRSYSYQLSAVDYEFLREVSLLLRGLGCPSRITLNREAGTKQFGDRTYDTQNCYVLSIGTSSVKRLGEVLGLPCQRLTTKDNEPQREALRFVKVVGVKPMRKAKEVYCFKESMRGRAVFNGILTGQCGEVPNRTDEPCSLGSLNLWRFVNLKSREINKSLLEDVTRVAFRFMDDILDRNTFPHMDISRAALLTRRLGLGVMGWADMLALLGIHYDTKEAVNLAGEVMQFIQQICYDESYKLAEKKGPYKGYDAMKTNGPFMRNETCNSIAPTGSICILIGGSSSSIEPHMPGMRTTNEGMKIVDNVCIFDHLDGFSPKFAHEIHWKWHIEHQAAFQQYVDLGVSKTINMPESSTKQDVSDAYRMMYEKNCKGGTIYRDKCRPEQVVVVDERRTVYSTNLSVDMAKDGDKDKTVKTYLDNGHVEKVQESPNKRPEGGETLSGGGKAPKLKRKRSLPLEVPSVRVKFKVNGAAGTTNCYLHVGLYEDGSPGEIFLRVSLQGSTVNGMLDSWAMTFSNALQHGTPLEDLIRLHEGSRFEPNGMTGVDVIPICSSIPDFVVRWMKYRFVTLKQMNGDTVDQEKLKAEHLGRPSGQMCPDCGQELLFRGGCLECLECHWTRCG